MKVDFVKSAVFEADYPQSSLPEVAIAGRSNAGKSSLINTIAMRAIAKVSGTPGKTRLLNFFNFNSKYLLVDMPGYGFASRSGDEQSEWHQMIETYLLRREQLVGLILVMDSRREWSEDEELLKRFSDSEGFPMMIAMTKIDKLTRNEINAALAKLKKASGLSAVFPVSALKKQGHDEVEDYAYKNWVAPASKKGKKS